MNIPKSSPSEILSSVHNATLKTWIPFYAKSSDITIDIDSQFDGIAAVPDVIDGKPTIIINPQRCMEQFDLTPSEFLVVLFHEIEHLFENAELRSSPEGKVFLKKKQQRREEQGVRASSYHQLENILRDMYVNTQVVNIKKVPALRKDLHDLYQDKFFAPKDYRQAPLHQQFMDAMLREYFVPEEKCEVADEVRKALNKMQKKFLGMPSIVEKTTGGTLAERLQAMWDLVEPTFKRFLEQDIKNHYQPKPPSGGGKGGGDNSGNSSDSGNSRDAPLRPAQAAGLTRPDGGADHDSDDSRDESGTRPEDDPLGKDDSDSGDGRDAPLVRPDGEAVDSDAGKDVSPEWAESENPFEKGYKAMGHLFDEEAEKKLEDQLVQDLEKKLEAAKEAQKSPEEKILEQRAKNLIKEKARKKLQEQGKDPNDPNNKDNLEQLQEEMLGSDMFQQTVEKLRQYQDAIHQLEQIKDPKSGKSVMWEILNLFEKIKSTRMKRRPFPKYPVDPDRGARLHGPSLAEGIADYYSGNADPEMFEMDNFREKRDKTVGKFEVTIIGDGSESMEGSKNKNQAKAILLVFEALKRLHDKIKLNKEGFSTSVEFETEGYLFSGSLPNKYIPLKEKGSDFSDDERLTVYSALGYAKGTTPDYKVLEKSYEEFMKDANRKNRQDIKDKKTKKLIFIFSDGGSDQKERLKTAINSRRKQGVYVYGIGIEDEADVGHYLTSQKDQGGGEICSDSMQLAQVMKKLLVDVIK